MVYIQAIEENILTSEISKSIDGRFFSTSAKMESSFGLRTELSEAGSPADTGFCAPLLPSVPLIVTAETKVGHGNVIMISKS